MATLNSDGTGFDLVQANAWHGIDPNMDETPWGTRITLGPTDLGPLKHLSHLPTWQGIGNPITPIATGYLAKVTMVLDDTSPSSGTHIH